MKKTHEYDSPALSRLVSVVTIFAICVCSVCSAMTCYKMASISAGTVAVGGNGGSGGTGSDGSGQGGAGSQGGSGSQGGASGENPGPVVDPSSEYTAEEILAKYTEVMDNLKQNVGGYHKKEFQMLQPDYNLGTVGNLVLPIAEGLMTSEEKAEDQVRDDYQQIPVIRNTKGCLLTDVSKIKSASMTEEGGKTTIVIVLVDEVGALPAEENATSCDSAVGSMFNPLNQKDIDNIVDKFSGVAKINEFTLTCKDCTATLVFDTESGQVESLNQIMNYLIEVDAKVFVASISGYATLTNNMTINQVTYK